MSTAAPTVTWFSQMQAFMDRAAQTGFYVHFQLIAFEKLGNDNATLANLTKIVNHFKNHPALFAWYLADEPDGQGIDPSLLQPKYDLIKKLDKVHPVSMVFCAGGASKFGKSFDVVMVDPYPIPNSPAESIIGPIETVRSLGKPIIMVPQAFGGGEGWARTPTAAEERIMTFLSVIYGAVGIQYFVRNAPIGFPYAASAWSEIRKISVEMLELAPAILNKRVNVSFSGPDSVHIGAWMDRDSSIVIIAANGHVSSISQFSVDCSPFINAGYIASAHLEFEGFDITIDSNGALKDTLRPFATQVYRLEKDHILPTNDEDNLVYNGGYEINGNPSVPDGNYVEPALDAGATFFSDPRISKEGRHSLVLRAPSDGNGTTMSPFHLSSLQMGKIYVFSVWLRGGGNGGQQVVFKFDASVFKNATTVHLVATTEWKQHSVQFAAASSSGANWCSYTLSTPGRVWLDQLSVVQANAALE